MSLDPILPKDGELNYVPGFFGPEEAHHLFERLLDSITWKAEEIVIFGRPVLQPRLTSWYGDAEAVYTYSGLTMLPLPWTPELSAIRCKLQHFTQKRFNSVLLNHYRDGDDYMGWHSDNERELGTHPTIASLSLGGTRKFQLKHRKDRILETITLEAESGSLIIMGGAIQDHWLHRVAPTRRPVHGRINLTFRMVNGKGPS